MEKKNRIVIFLGAGFPIPWGAPKSEELGENVKSILASSPFCFLSEKYPSTKFEEIVDGLYSYATFTINQLQQELYLPSTPVKVNLDETSRLYLESINRVMALIHKYEQYFGSPQNQGRNQYLQSLFNVLEERYKHVSVYTTNYDEALPRILGWKEQSLSVNNNCYLYSPIKQHGLKRSYLNLHGSIHLKLGEFDGQQYAINYSPTWKPLMNLCQSQGGNPNEFGLFTPIIVGRHKTQQILSKHFEYAATCFANDLSDCETFLAIGSSFKDTHLNAMIRQYTHQRPVNYRIVTLADDVVFGSRLDNKVMSDIIAYGVPYTIDTPKDKLFIRENGRLIYYKRGTDIFLSDREFWVAYL